MQTSVIRPEAHHYLGIEMNQQVWKLLGQEDRDDNDNRRMEHFALASLFHWERSPKYAPINAQRGRWLLARVYTVLERGDEAMLHAERCMGITRDLDLKGFDRAYAYEALARAHASAGNTERTKDLYQMAHESGEAIAKDEDKKVFMSDLEEQPWNVPVLALEPVSSLRKTGTPAGTGFRKYHHCKPLRYTSHFNSKCTAKTGYAKENK